MNTSQSTSASVLWAWVSRCALVTLVGFGAVACVHVVEGGEGLPERRSDEEVARSSVELGLAYLRAGDRVSAKRPLLHALEVDPNVADVHHALALVYAGDLEHQLAEQHYERALQLNPEYTQARNNFGAWLHGRGRNEEAVAQLELAVSDTLYPRRALVFENLARAYRGVGRDAQAMASFRRAVNLEPKLYVSHMELSELHLAAGQLDEAYQHFRVYDQLKVQPSARGLWLGIQLESALENRDAVASYALQLRSMFPASEEYRLYRETAE